MKLNSVLLMDVFDFLDNEVENNSIDLAIIDPPYNVLNEDWDIFENNEKYFDFTFKWLDKVLLKLKDSGTIYLFNNAFNSAIILIFLIKKNIKFQNWIIWYKKDGFNGTKKRYTNNQETIFFLQKQKIIFLILIT